MPPPPVYIAANPYEGRLCIKALADTGLRVEMLESIESTLKKIAEERPLVVVIADGWAEADARELLVEVRSEYDHLPIFLVENPASDIRDQEAAVRRGASRLFVRPIDPELLAHEIEKLAVEAEGANEAVPALELEAASGEEWEELDPPAPLARIDLRRVERLPELSLPPEPPLPRVPTEVLGPAPVPAAHSQPGLPAPPASASLPPQLDKLRVEPLLRADDAMEDAAGMRLAELVQQPQVSVQVNDLMPPRARPQPLPDRSTFARRLERELSEVERRLFPDSPSSPRGRREEYDDALGDVDLDSLGLDTIPGIGLDRLEAEMLEPTRPTADRQTSVTSREGSETDVPIARTGTAPLIRLAGEHALAPAPPLLEQNAGKPIPDEGTLHDSDLAELVFSLLSSGFSGCLQLKRGDGEKHLFFEAGAPVFATSSYAHDRLGDMLWREGKLTREQHALTRALTSPPGRRTAAALIEASLLKQNELFAVLRRQVEEIIHSCFGWDSGSYKLGPEQPEAEDRLRLANHPYAIFFEGIRRKYGLERLVDLVGPPETVLTPTTALERVLADAVLTPSERAAAETFDGELSLTDLKLQLSGVAGVSLTETQLYALAWSLVACGAARVGVEESGGLGVRAASTLVTPESSLRDRRRERRETNGDARPEDRAIERERLLAKRAQVHDGDYFAVLGIERDATPHEIERAYQRLRIDFAPDGFHDAVRAELAGAIDEIQEVLAEAHRVLMEEPVRVAYRSHLNE